MNGRAQHGQKRTPSNLQLELLDPFPGLVDTLVHLVGVGALADRRRALTTGFAADYGSDLFGPVCSDGPFGRELL